MGDNLLRQQIRNFRKRQDLARTEAMMPKLFERSEVTQTVYEATPQNGDAFNLNDTLYAIPEGENVVALAKGNRKVAIIDGDAGKSLHDALAEPDTAGVIRMRVMSISDISGTISVQPMSE